MMISIRDIIDYPTNNITKMVAESTFRLGLRPLDIYICLNQPEKIFLTKFAIDKRRNTLTEIDVATRAQFGDYVQCK